MTKTKVPEILWPAQRQYRHNSGDDALVFGFDQYETVKVVTSLQKRIADLEEQVEDLKYDLRISQDE